MAFSNGVAHASTGSNPVCDRVGKSIQVSSGAMMYCFGPQASAPTSAGAFTAERSFSSNVNAANPAEDVADNGTRAYGQSEVSVGGEGAYVVEAWNDSTGFFQTTCDALYKEELTGYGFSANGGKSFTDRGGLVNSNCADGSRFFGDPSVEVLVSGGHTYFYISSLYFNAPENGIDIAMDVCVASGTGSAATLSCQGPVIIAPAGPDGFLDKDFLAVDRAHKKLYASYTNFSGVGGDVIQLSSCDLTSPASPVCGPPQTVFASTDCAEEEGAYPAVDEQTGDVYVAWEHNWATNLFGCADPVQEMVAYLPGGSAPTAFTSVPVIAMDSAFVPGYNRFPMNDFPRIATSPAYGTVTIVWNDARYHPAGDILLQSFHLGSLAAVQSAPIRVNANSGGWHLLPALRYSTSTGKLDISYYERTSANTAITNVDATLNVVPTAVATPSGEVLVTTQATDWQNVSSDIVPNFGDYTDNYIIGKTSYPYTGGKVYIAWSDGRLGLPQPFEAFHSVS
jgi:hypothetical protein